MQLFWSYFFLSNECGIHILEKLFSDFRRFIYLSTWSDALPPSNCSPPGGNSWWLSRKPQSFGRLNLWISLYVAPRGPSLSMPYCRDVGEVLGRNSILVKKKVSVFRIEKNFSIPYLIFPCKKLCNCFWSLFFLKNAVYIVINCNDWLLLALPGHRKC